MQEVYPPFDRIQEFYPRPISLQDASPASIRPLEETDEQALFDFFQVVPEKERLFLKHHVHDRHIIRRWCHDMEWDRIFPLIAVDESGKVLASSTLHQSLGGWKRHIGRVSVFVHPQWRKRGLAQALVKEIIRVARECTLEHLEAEFLLEQERAIQVFSLFGFAEVTRLSSYVKDMQGERHDYLLMSMDLRTDEEYAGMG